MRRRVAILICVLSLAASTRALAHHSFTAEFDADKPIKLTGTLTKVEWTNPHIWIFMDVKNADGTVTNWGFEMPGPTQLLRAGIKSTTMKVGDMLTIDARRARDGGNTANAQTVIAASTGKQLFPAPAQ